MTQALKKPDVTKSKLHQDISSANAKDSDTVKTQDATILNVDQSKVFSRFLEASCDCV